MTPAGQDDRVSIVTPTIPGRERELLRCMAAVLALDWPRLQHVIVSDRTDQQSWLEFEWNRLAAEAGRYDQQRAGLAFVQLNESWRDGHNDRDPGAFPWGFGTRLALGEFVGFCGDDDELLPDHVTAHVQAMRADEATWSVSQTEFWVGGAFSGTVIGDASYQLGHLDATGVMCWKGALRHATWGSSGPTTGCSDWQLVQDWQRAGLRGTFVDKITARHHDGWMVGKTGQPYR